MIKHYPISDPPSANHIGNCCGPREGLTAIVWKSNQLVWILPQSSTEKDFHQFGKRLSLHCMHPRGNRSNHPSTTILLRRGSSGAAWTDDSASSMDEDDNQTNSDMVVLFPWQDKHSPFFFYHGEYFTSHRWSHYGVSCVDKSDTAEYHVCHLLKEKGILFQVPQ